MPTRNLELTDRQPAMVARQAGHREAGDNARLVALRTAASAGTQDFATGRYHNFVSGTALRSHLAARADMVLPPG